MIVYRLAHTKYAKLQASGLPNRWNKAEQFVLNTSQSISLCALELLAHTGGVRSKGTFKIMHIEVKNVEDIPEQNPTKLPKDWQQLSAYHLTQEVGSAWYESANHLLLKVPSVLVPSEWNYVINTKHSKFSKKVRILEMTDFFWDHRFPQN